MHASTLLASIMAHQRADRGKRKIYVFVDLKKAYDSVRRDQLFAMLVASAKSAEEMKIIQILFELHREGTMVFD